MIAFEILALCLIGVIWGFFASLFFVSTNSLTLRILGVLYSSPLVFAPFENPVYLSFSLACAVTMYVFLSDKRPKLSLDVVKDYSDSIEKRRRFYWTNEGIRSKKNENTLYPSSRIFRGGQCVTIYTDPTDPQRRIELSVDEIESIDYQDKHAVVTCPRCHQKCRVPRIRTVAISCPACNEQWVQHLDA